MDFVLIPTAIANPQFNPCSCTYMIRTEIASSCAHPFSGQKSFLVLCMMTFPAWFLLLFVALGVIKLPFDIPGLDNLLM